MPFAFLKTVTICIAVRLQKCPECPIPCHTYEWTFTLLPFRIWAYFDLILILRMWQSWLCSVLNPNPQSHTHFFLLALGTMPSSHEQAEASLLEKWKSARLRMVAWACCDSSLEAKRGPLMPTLNQARIKKERKKNEKCTKHIKINRLRWSHT